MSKIAKSMAVLGVVAGLGVAALPLGTYAATQSEPVTIKAVVDSSIQISTSSKEVVISTIVPGTSKIYQNSVDVTVETSKPKYNLNIKDSDNTTDLVSESGGKIPAIAPVADGSANGWGFMGGDVTSWTAVTTKEQPIRTNAAIEATDTTTVDFGVSAKDLADGTYEGAVVFTATAVDAA